MSKLVVDANIMISAILGESFPRLIALFRRGVELTSPVQQFAETRSVLRHRLADLADVDAAMRNLLALIEPIAPARFMADEDAARARLGTAGRNDWPVLAAAMTLRADIWSNDRDFFGVGVPIWSSRNIHFRPTPS